MSEDDKIPDDFEKVKMMNLSKVSAQMFTSGMGLVSHLKNEYQMK